MYRWLAWATHGNPYHHLNIHMGVLRIYSAHPPWKKNLGGPAAWTSSWAKGFLGQAMTGETVGCKGLQGQALQVLLVLGSLGEFEEASL